MRRALNANGTRVLAQPRITEVPLALPCVTEVPCDVDPRPPAGSPSPTKKRVFSHDVDAVQPPDTAVAKIPAAATLRSSTGQLDVLRISNALAELVRVATPPQREDLQTRYPNATTLYFRDAMQRPAERLAALAHRWSVPECNARFVGLTPLKAWMVHNVGAYLFAQTASLRAVQVPEKLGIVSSWAGSGVSSYVTALCTEWGINLIVVRPDGIESGMLAETLRAAMDHQPCVVLMDRCTDLFREGDHGYAARGREYMDALRSASEHETMQKRARDYHAFGQSTLAGGVPGCDVWTLFSLTHEFPASQRFLSDASVSPLYVHAFSHGEIASFFSMYVAFIVREQGGCPRDIEHVVGSTRTLIAQWVQVLDELSGGMPTPGNIVMFFQRIISRKATHRSITGAAVHVDASPCDIWCLPTAEELRTEVLPYISNQTPDAAHLAAFHPVRDANAAVTLQGYTTHERTRPR